MKAPGKTLCLALLLLSGVLMAESELPLGATCRRDFAAVDDKADTEIRELNRLVKLLESEIADPALAASDGDFRGGLQLRLEAAKLRRSEALDKQHADLNAIRERCDVLREREKPSNALDDSAS